MALRFLAVLALLGPALVASAACGSGGAGAGGEGGGGGGKADVTPKCEADLIYTGVSCDTLGFSCTGISKCLCGPHFTPKNVETSCTCRDSSGGLEWLCDDDCTNACGGDDAGPPKVGTPNSYPDTCVGASDYIHSLGCSAEKPESEADIAETCASIDARCPGENHVWAACIVEKAITCDADGEVTFVDGDGCTDELQNVAYCLEHSG